MVPSITTHTRKDGTKRKHRYYVCSDFHNKGSAACRANSIKAYEAEETVIKKIEQLQARYMEAFEKNTLPVDILQESLQKVSNEKRELEPEKTEIAIQLGSIDSKVIQPELVETLLKRFLSTYKKTSRGIKNNYSNT